MAKEVIEAKPVTKVTDDFDGKPLPGDTKATRYDLLGKKYDLYLSAENKATVDKFLSDLTDGADVVKTAKKKAAQSFTHIPLADRKKRLEAVNKANGTKYTQYIATVDNAWKKLDSGN